MSIPQIHKGDLLNGQVAIITGAARGIGAATAKLFAAQGAKVIITDRNAGPANETAKEIRADGGDALAVPGDITDPAFPAKLVEETIAKFGALHILVNNAGYTWDGMLHKMADDQWQAMMDIHLAAPFRLVRAAAPHMRDAAKNEQSEGRTPDPRCIINISSTSGLHGNAGQANYSAAKAGIVGFTKTIAKEWGPFGVRCNAVAFGYIETRLTQPKETGENIDIAGKSIPLGIPGHLRDMALMVIPLARAGTPEEAAGGILLLASPFATYINGHTLEVTGGMGI